MSAVRAARLALGWTQAELSRASGVSEVSIARLETAALSPRLSTISKIQSALQAAGATIALNHPTGGYSIAISPDAIAESRRRLGKGHSKC